MKTGIAILLALPLISALAAWWSTALLARHEDGRVWTRS
jgi:hypothetical protein